MKHHPPLTDTQRILVEENLGLISFAMNKLPIYLFDSREDAFQIGVIGLMKAARSYDPDRKILFATYAVPCITNELRMALRHINTARETLSEVIAALKKMKDPDAFNIIRMVVQNRKQEEIADKLGIT